MPSVWDIRTAFDELGDTPWEALDALIDEGVRFDADYDNPLFQFLERRLKGLQLYFMSFDHGHSYENAVRVIDRDEQEDIIVRIPKHLQLVVDYWPEMIDNPFIRRIYDEPVDNIRPLWHPSYETAAPIKAG